MNAKSGYTLTSLRKNQVIPLLALVFIGCTSSVQVIEQPTTFTVPADSGQGYLYGPETQVVVNPDCDSVKVAAEILRRTLGDIEKQIEGYLVDVDLTLEEGERREVIINGLKQQLGFAGALRHSAGRCKQTVGSVAHEICPERGLAGDGALLLLSLRGYSCVNGRDFLHIGAWLLHRRFPDRTDRAPANDKPAKPFATTDNHKHICFHNGHGAWVCAQPWP